MLAFPFADASERGNSHSGFPKLWGTCRQRFWACLVFTVFGQKWRQAMMFRKTRQDKRGTYRFEFTAMDEKGNYFLDSVELKPGEEGVTELWIKMLHSMDDSLVNNNIKNGKPKVEDWQKAGIEQWKKQHPGEEVPKNWNLSLDGLTQTEDADHSKYMKEISEKTMEEEMDPLKELLYECLEEMDEDAQKLYKLFYLERQSQKDIAEVFGISQMAVSKRLKKLEEALKEACRKKL